MTSPRSTVRTLCFVCLVVLTGCATGSPPQSPTDTTSPAAASSPPTGTEPAVTREATSDALAPVLVGLIEADNRSQYAAAHDLQYLDGRVLVVVELSPSGSIPEAYDVRIEQTATGADRTYVQAYVAIDALRELYAEPDVRTIRQPRAPATSRS